MQCNPCRVVKCFPIECSGFHAAWLNAVDSMQGALMEPYWMQRFFLQHDSMQWSPHSMTACSGFMQHGPKLPDSMQWIPFSVIECRVFHALWRNGSRLYAVESMQRGQIIPIECCGLYGAWPKSSRFNAVDSMQRDWLQCNPCSVVKCIPIECSGFHAAWLNAVESMQGAVMEPYWM